MARRRKKATGLLKIRRCLFPNLVPARNNPDLSLTIYNASSSAKTLTTMLIIAGIGVPIVIAYTVFIYRVFKGKVRPGELYGKH